MNESLDYNEISAIINKVKAELSRKNTRYHQVRHDLKVARRNGYTEKIEELNYESKILKQSITQTTRSLAAWKDRLSKTPKPPKPLSKKNQRRLDISVEKSHAKQNSALLTQRVPPSYKQNNTRIKLLSPVYYSNNSTSQKFDSHFSIQHNKYGLGTIISKKPYSITILFADGTQRDFENPDFLLDIGILKFPEKFPPTQNIKHLDSPVSVPSTNQNEVLSDAIQFKSQFDTLYVYTGRIKCIRDKHDMVCVNALIDTASGETATLNVNCCLNCNRFYISYDEYEHYMEKYKSLLTRIVLVNQNGESTFTNKLAIESTLKLCGYSVSQEKGLSTKERQTLLANVIHNGIVSKPDVIQHLNWLINMNGKKAGNSIAKEKWEKDLAFVRNLDLRLQSNHKISNVMPYTSHKKRHD